MAEAERSLLTRIVAVAASVLLISLIAGSANASAQTFQSVYHPNAESRTFSTSPGGWTASNSSEGLCIPFINCPSLTNSFEASGGVQDDGYISTSLFSLAGVAATSVSRWVSPTFTYNGADGREPNEVAFAMFRRADVAALLDVVGNSAEFAVSLERIAGGVPVQSLQVLPLTTLSGADNWTSTGAVPIDPSDLTMGQTYRFVITSRFETGVEVLPGGSADYDHVALRAVLRPSETGPPGPPGAPGAGGTLTREQLRELARRALLGRAIVRGNTVRLQFRCVGASPRPCRFTRVRVKNFRRGGMLTNAIKFRVQRRDRRTVSLRIRDRQARQHLLNTRRVRINYVLHVGQQSLAFSTPKRVRRG